MNEEEKIDKTVNSLKEWKKIHSIVKDRCHAKLTYNEVDLVLNLIEKLQKENELLKKQVEYDKTHIYTPQTIELNYVSKQKIKDKIEGIQKEYNKLDKQVDEYINDVNKDLSTYYENKERIAIMQTLMWFIDVLQELIEESEKK